MEDLGEDLGRDTSDRNEGVSEPSKFNDLASEAFANGIDRDIESSYVAVNSLDCCEIAFNRARSTGTRSEFSTGLHR